MLARCSCAPPRTVPALSLVRQSVPAVGGAVAPAETVFSTEDWITAAVADVRGHLYVATQRRVVGLDPGGVQRFRVEVPFEVKDLALGDGFLLVRGQRELLRVD